ncbi:hypothetical protein VTO73DRAFT_3608 [Trametes versicolor]
MATSAPVAYIWCPCGMQSPLPASTTALMSPVLAVTLGPVCAVVSSGARYALRLAGVRRRTLHADGEKRWVHDGAQVFLGPENIQYTPCTRATPELLEVGAARLLVSARAMPAVVIASSSVIDAEFRKAAVQFSRGTLAVPRLWHDTPFEFAFEHVVEEPSHMLKDLPIERAREFDNKMADKMSAAEKSAVLPNHLNTEKHRMIKNASRAKSRIKKASEYYQAHGELMIVDDQLQEARARLKEAQDAVKTLGAAKKQLRDTTGIKTTRALKSQKVISDATHDIAPVAPAPVVPVAPAPVVPAPVALAAIAPGVHLYTVLKVCIPFPKPL